jgi:hypothetical protein
MEFLRYNVFMLFSFFVWWYGPGWLSAIRDIPKRTVGVSRSFSVAILVKTLFAPWKRITTVPGAGLDAKLRAIVDNMMSRLIGFTVRLIVLVAALLLSLGTLIFFTLVALAWPLLPPAVVYCAYRVVVG